MLQYWLGVDLPFVDAISVPACECKKQVFGEPLQCGYHWDGICHKTTAIRNERHNSVRDIFFRAYKEVGVTTVQREPLGLYSGTNARPADLFVPDVTNVALDFVITNPRSASALSRNPDKCSLVAANMAESKKEKEHEAMVEKYGLGFLDFNKCGVAFESSGAFGKTAKKVWSRLKFLADEADLDNYVIAEKPYTWTAFTFEQMFPQRVSWAIMVHNAEQILCGARISRRFIQPHMRGV
jgi:hypothetical protein